MLHIFLLKTFFAYEKIYYEPEMGDCTPDIRDRVCFQAVTEPWFVEAYFTFTKRICKKAYIILITIGTFTEILQAVGITIKPRKIRFLLVLIKLIIQGL